MTNKKIKRKQQLKKKKFEPIVKDDYKIKLTIRIISIILLLILTSSLVILGVEKDKENILFYQEVNNVDYKVHLKENDYYDETVLDKDMEYIASLIDYVDVNFNYAFKASENVNSSFSYYIMGDVLVYDQENPDKLIYKKSYPLTEKETIKVEDDKTVFIEENTKVDYNFYNDTIKSFTNEYNLPAQSKLQLTLYVEGNGNTNLSTPVKTNSNSSLEIPLTEQTINIKVDCEPVHKSEIILNNSKEENRQIFVTIAIISSLVLVLLIVDTILFKVDNKKEKSKYELYLKKLLKEYNKVIAETKNIDLSHADEIIETKNFEELLNIRNNLQLPILFLEKKKNEMAWFVVKNRKEYYRFTLKNDNLEEE